MGTPWVTPADLDLGELGAAREFGARFQALNQNYQQYVAVLLRLPHFVGRVEPAESPEGVYHGWAWQRYVTTAYTFRALFLLCQAGYYDECLPLVRHLVEVLVQIRYFMDHKPSLEGHWQNDRPVPFRNMCDAHSPGYYGPFYGDQLSSPVHGKLLLGLFRFELGDGNVRARQGLGFIERVTGYIMNHALILLLGFLRLFPRAFPGAQPFDEGTAATYRECMASLQGWWDGFRATEARAAEWAGHMQRFVE